MMMMMILSPNKKNQPEGKSLRNIHTNCLHLTDTFLRSQYIYAVVAAVNNNS